MAKVTWPRRGGLGGQSKIVIPAIFGLGAGELEQGQVVSKAVDGKWYKLVQEMSQSGQKLKKHDATDFAAADAGLFFLPHRHIIPDTLTISATNNITDNGSGSLMAAGNVNAVGAIDYATGIGVFYSARAALNPSSAAYHHGDPGGKSVPAGILITDKIDLSATAEASGAILVFGEWQRDMLVWPANMAADEIERMRNLLAAAGIAVRR